MTYFPLAAGMHRLGLNLSDVQDEFLYIGGDRGRHANYFKLSCPDEPYPKHEDYCVCGHCIDENCYIRSPTSGRTLIVGNCCIKRYVSVDGRTCKKCGVRHKNQVIDLCNDCRPKKGRGAVCDICAAPHKNRKDNLCSDCRIRPPCAVCSERSPLWVAGEHVGCCHKCCPPPPPRKGRDENYCDLCARPCKAPYNTCWDCNNGGQCVKCCGVCPIRFKECWKCRSLSPLPSSIRFR